MGGGREVPQPHFLDGHASGHEQRNRFTPGTSSSLPCPRRERYGNLARSGGVLALAPRLELHSGGDLPRTSVSSPMPTTWRNMLRASYAQIRRLEDLSSEMLVTVQIAIWGTFLAHLFGIPFRCLPPTMWRRLGGPAGTPTDGCLPRHQ